MVRALQIVKCLFGRHEHRARVSRDEQGVVRSRCKGCGQRMVRVEEGWQQHWRLEKKARKQPD